MNLQRDTIQTDYLVTGTGATAMAFVDTLLTETNNDILMVDRRDHPGGHWNDAYPFVRLHQPSAYYGVCSRELGQPRISSASLNAGLYELASRDEILDYYDRVMRDRFLPSGRVRWFPLSEHAIEPDGAHRITSLANGMSKNVVVAKRHVNSTHACVEVPSTHRPGYAVAPNVKHVPISSLPGIRHPYQRYTIVGGGKTGIDACLWLLDHGVDPKRLQWIVPRDAWLIDRGMIQPFAENFERTTSNDIEQFQSIVDANSVRHLFELLEARGVLLRLDTSVEPAMYHCATVSQAELQQLRRIDDVVRLGRVTTIESGRVVLEHGSLGAPEDTLYVDCSASAVKPLPDIPVFDGSTINLLWVRWCQPLFSAAFIAFVESRFEDDSLKNALCKPVSSSIVPSDWPLMWQQSLDNVQEWQKQPAVLDWLADCRLDAQTARERGLDAGDPKRKRMLEMVAATAAEAAARLPRLLANEVP